MAGITDVQKLIDDRRQREASELLRLRADNDRLRELLRRVEDETTYENISGPTLDAIAQELRPNGQLG